MLAGGMAAGGDGPRPVFDHRRDRACLTACTLGGAWGKDFVEQSGAEFQTGLNIRN